MRVTVKHTGAVVASKAWRVGSSKMFFIERRAVADLELVIDDRRTHRQRDQPLAVGCG